MYTIYKRTLPDGRAYIGVTCHSLEQRARADGADYKCLKFYEAIIDVGWENIQSEVLATTDDIKEAARLEKEYIVAFVAEHGEAMSLNNPIATAYGWSDDARAAAGKSISELWKTDEYRKKVLAGVRAYWDNLPAEKRAKLSRKQSESHRKLHADPEFKAKFNALMQSPERRAVLSEAIRNSEKHKAAMQSDEHRELMRQKTTDYFKDQAHREADRQAVLNSERFWESVRKPERCAKISEHSKGCSWIHKDGVNRYVKGVELERLLNDGWELGQARKDHIVINNGVRQKRVLPESLDRYLSTGEWILGAIKGTRVWMNDGTQNKKIKIDEVSEFESTGWVRGKISRR